MLGSNFILFIFGENHSRLFSRIRIIYLAYYPGRFGTALLIIQKKLHSIVARQNLQMNTM